MANLIEAEHLCRYYGRYCANNVSFTLAKGEVLGFVGPNDAYLIRRRFTTI